MKNRKSKIMVNRLLAVLLGLMIYFSACAPFFSLLKKGPSMFTPRITAPLPSLLNKGRVVFRIFSRISSLKAIVVPKKVVTP